MTYDARETSQAGGEPVELFRFVAGANVYAYTSADQPQVLASETYTPEAIHRTQVELDGESTKGAIEVTVPRINPIAAYFVAYAPEPPITLTVAQLHRDEAEVIQSTWEVGTARFTGSELVLTCVPSDSTMGRRIPRNTFKTQCNRALYSPRCGVVKDLFKVAAVITVISGDTIHASAFATKPDGWFNNGWVELATGQRRWVVNHVGSTITLMSPFLGLAVNDPVVAFAGCNRTESDCATKFANLVNHFGFARIPTHDPFHQGLKSTFPDLKGLA